MKNVGGRFAGIALATVLLAAVPVTPVLANQDWRGEDGQWRRERHVHAPFTLVETRPGRSAEVHAPFTAVRSERRGVWVRAPFVNLFVPR